MHNIDRKPTQRNNVLVFVTNLHTQGTLSSTTAIMLSSQCICYAATKEFSHMDVSSIEHTPCLSRYLALQLPASQTIQGNFIATYDILLLHNVHPHIPNLHSLQPNNYPPYLLQQRLVPRLRLPRDHEVRTPPQPLSMRKLCRENCGD